MVIVRLCRRNQQCIIGYLGLGSEMHRKRLYYKVHSTIKMDVKRSGARVMIS